jgi:hypothetical protein
MVVVWLLAVGGCCRLLAVVVSCEGVRFKNVYLHSRRTIIVLQTVANCGIPLRASFFKGYFDFYRVE